MPAFDRDDPPKSYKKFRRQVIRTIEDMEVGADDDYTTAVFVTDRKGNADIMSAFEIYKAAQAKMKDGEIEEEDIDEDDVLYEYIPKAIKSYGANRMAMVLPAENNLEEDILLLFLSDQEHFELLVAEVELDEEEEYCELGSWFNDDPEENFPQLMINLRRSVCPQG